MGRTAGALANDATVAMHVGAGFKPARVRNKNAPIILCVGPMIATAPDQHYGKRAGLKPAPTSVPNCDPHRPRLPYVSP
jgi:hypothetical protein